MMLRATYSRYHDDEAITRRLTRGDHQQEDAEISMEISSFLKDRHRKTRHVGNGDSPCKQSRS